MIDHWGMHGLASLPSSGGGGGKEKASRDIEGDGSTGSKNSGGASGSGKEGFDWDNFDWEKFKRYYKIAEGVRSVLKLISSAAMVAASGSAYVLNKVDKRVDERVEAKIKVEPPREIHRPCSL
ncbi:uncharacterized protein LOC124684191 [Lolium rigidum]|uniref:uncharacterized protein LOC124684191 n=1 Tax=Lolium rigidum TaxID=89674 RepID=UPI001F5D5218|nr:uncharacterized protein LOC124684191 [Lolium rigidum]